MKYLITSALPYINGIKHLGNLIGSLLPSDVYARFLRQQGEEVLFISGTDEHGTPAEIAAKNEGMEVAAYCEKMYLIQKNIYENFNIKFDYFGRSSALSNHQITQEIFRELDANKYIIEKEIEQIYSIDDARFLPDRYVVGICPHCQFDKARGDQCDQCGRLLDPIELLSPRSSISGSTNLEVRREKHLFIALDLLSDPLRKWLATKKDWPAFSVSIANKWLNEGLNARCISRDLKWGIPIPKKGFEDKVFYVWFDAPMAYIAITKDWAREIKKNCDAWKEWWLGNHGEVCYVQFMAKDNLPFHSIMWPAMLLGADTNWKTVDILKGFHWLTYEGGKFSTSLNRGIFSDTALELFPADYWRYYLLATIPETSDSDFKLPDFIATVNKDLVGILGNFINRVSTLIAKYFDNKVPPYSLDNQYIKLLTPKCVSLVLSIKEDYYAVNIRSVMRSIRELWALGNEFITEAAPWTLIKTDKVATGNVLAACLHLIRVYSCVSYPIIPSSAEKMFSYINSSNENLEKIKIDDSANFSLLKPGVLLKDIGLLFEKISDVKEKELLQQFN
jgi:methionyl-tRNA synthetase